MTPHMARFLLVFNCMNYALCIMHYALCIMHYAIKQLHYAQKIALQRLIDLFSKNDAFQSRMFICYLFVILMMNCVFCIMRYAISIMHYAGMHFFPLNFKCIVLGFFCFQYRHPTRANLYWFLIA